MTPLVLAFLPVRFIVLVVRKTIKNVKTIQYASDNYKQFKASDYDENESNRLDSALRTLRGMRKYNEDDGQDKC